MKEILNTDKIKLEPNKSISVGSEYHFWLNEEDDLYDELYRERDEAQTGRSVSR